MADDASRLGSIGRQKAKADQPVTERVADRLGPRHWLGLFCNPGIERGKFWIVDANADEFALSGSLGAATFICVITN